LCVSVSATFPAGRERDHASCRHALRCKHACLIPLLDSGHQHSIQTPKPRRARSWIRSDSTTEDGTTHRPGRTFGGQANGVTLTDSNLHCMHCDCVAVLCASWTALGRISLNTGRAGVILLRTNNRIGRVHASSPPQQAAAGCSNALLWTGASNGNGS
jgi:hypothetical protein